MPFTKQVLALIVIGTAGASARGQVGASSAPPVMVPAAIAPATTSFAAFPDLDEPPSKLVRRGPLRNVTETNPYGDDPSGTKPRGPGLDRGIDESNPYAFAGSVSPHPGSALPKMAALRELDSENPYGSVEHAPIDADNPYVKTSR